MGSRVNPQSVKSDWIDSDEAQSHIVASAMTNENVDEAFMSVADLAYKHHMKTTSALLDRAGQMGEAVNLNAIRSISSNFKLGNNRAAQKQDTLQTKQSSSCCGGNSKS